MPTGAATSGHAFTAVTSGGGPMEQAPLGQVVDTWAWYSANDSGATNTLRRTAVGSYEVMFPGIGRVPDHVQVTPYGEPTARCSVDGWTSDSRPEAPGAASVMFRCVDAAGRPADSYASVAYVSAATPMD